MNEGVESLGYEVVVTCAGEEILRAREEFLDHARALKETLSEKFPLSEGYAVHVFHLTIHCTDVTSLTEVDG